MNSLNRDANAINHHHLMLTLEWILFYLATKKANCL